MPIHVAVRRASEQRRRSRWFPNRGGVPAPKSPTSSRVKIYYYYRYCYRYYFAHTSGPLPHRQSGWPRPRWSLPQGPWQEVGSDAGSPWVPVPALGRDWAGAAAVDCETQPQAETASAFFHDGYLDGGRAGARLRWTSHQRVLVLTASKCLGEWARAVTTWCFGFGLPDVLARHAATVRGMESMDRRLDGIAAPYCSGQAPRRTSQLEVVVTPEVHSAGCRDRLASADSPDTTASVAGRRMGMP
ncbi:hypothetical protein E5D57_012058 [Metarhizium anisopliae]|nr:hypothetical protein E5D57_012058 [Metarhizium anisopliae]